MTAPPATHRTLPSFAVEWQGCVRQSSPQEIDQFVNQLTAQEAAILLYEWPLWARAKQLPPPGDWRVWLLLAGRGFGKTRAGAEWIRALATSGKARQIALVGDTADDVRQVMVEGPSGILAVSPRAERPQWRRSALAAMLSGAVSRKFHHRLPLSPIIRRRAHVPAPNRN